MHLSQRFLLFTFVILGIYDIDFFDDDSTKIL